MEAVGIFSVLGAILGLVIGILWLVIGWRAMRAHEDLAQTHFELKREIRQLAETLGRNNEKSRGSGDRGVGGIDPAKLPRFKD